MNEKQMSVSMASRRRIFNYILLDCICTDRRDDKNEWKFNTDSSAKCCNEWSHRCEWLQKLTHMYINVFALALALASKWQTICVILWNFAWCITASFKEKHLWILSQFDCKIWKYSNYQQQSLEFKGISENKLWFAEK